MTGPNSHQSGTVKKPRVLVLAAAWALGSTFASISMAQSSVGGLRLSHSLTLPPVAASHLGAAVVHSAPDQPTPAPVFLAPAPALAAENGRLATERAAKPVAKSIAHWASQSPGLTPDQGPCARAANPTWAALSMDEALAISLCKSPALRQALASVAEQSAGVALAENAKRPTWSASLGANGARNFIAGATNTRSVDANVNMGWVLFDFGRSDAQLTEARQTLAAALSSQGNTLLDAVRDVVALYGDAVVADAALKAATEAERTAELTTAAAQARYDAQVGTQLDRLQSQTALAQATLARVRAAGAWDIARGKLALALGADIAQPLQTTLWEPWGVAPSEEAGGIDALRAEAHAHHPKLRSARAQISALQARLASVQASGRGSVSLAANVGQASNWGANGTTTTVSNVPSTSLGVTASFPLFNGMETDAQLAQVGAQMAAKEAELEALQREVAAALWQAHRALITSAQSVQASERLLAAATGTFEVAQGRYKAGVGSLVDLLSAQSALADGRRQQVAALVEKLTARTALTLATGRMGVASKTSP